MSYSHIPSNRFLCKILSVWCLYENDITVNQISLFVVLFIVSFTCSIPISHRLPRSSVNTDYRIPLDCNFFACIKYYNSIPTWYSCLVIGFTFTLATNLCYRVLMSYKGRYFLSLSYFPTKFKFSP